MGLRHYLSFIRFRYHITFVTVLAGAFLSAGFSFSTLIRLVLFYVTFNVLLYGGMYTLNDVIDATADAQHPKKMKRAIPSGNVKATPALLFATCLIAAGILGVALLFKRNILYLCLVILLLNLWYTLSAKKIPYLELVVNSATHPLRFLIGMLIAGGAFISSPILAVFFLALGLACVRRVVEKDVAGWQARKTLRFYAKSSLSFIQLLSFLGIILTYAFSKNMLVLLTLPTYVVLVFGIYFSTPIRRAFRSVWTS